MPCQSPYIKKNLGFYGKLWENNMSLNWNSKQITQMLPHSVHNASKNTKCRLLWRKYDAQKSALTVQFSQFCRRTGRVSWIHRYISSFLTKKIAIDSPQIDISHEFPILLESAFFKSPAPLTFRARHCANAPNQAIPPCTRRAANAP